MRLTLASTVRSTVPSTVSTRVLVPFLVVALGLVAGCSDQDDKKEGATGETSGVPTEESEPSEAATAEIEPAAGQELSRDGLTLRLPEGWEAESDPGPILVEGRDPETMSSVYLAQIRVLNSEEKDLARLADNDARIGGYDTRPTIEPETTVQGVDVYHVKGLVSDEVTETYGALVDRDLVTIQFRFDEGVRESLQQEVMDAVLASVDWT